MNVPSAAALLVKILRFLELDLQPDWLNVTTNSFRVSKNAQVTQKDRLRCAEFVLYKLFELWDYASTKFVCTKIRTTSFDANNTQKLRPFYPALEPRQSIKLRAVLFQMLSQLKVEGVLPRDCALRKTMLDDCQGEKFEELLFLFSAIVLRKVLNRGDSGLPPGHRLATATSLNEEEAANVATLSLVLSRSLSESLAVRQQRRARLASLNVDSLQTADTLLQREERSGEGLEQDIERLRVADVELESLRQRLHDEHSVDQVLLEIGLSGDAEEGRNMAVEDSFSNIWQPTLDGKPLIYDPRPPGLLVDLEHRVELQKARLQEWKQFQVEVSRRNEELVVLPSPMKSPPKSPTKSPFKSPAKSKAIRPIPLHLRSMQGRTPRLAPPSQLASTPSTESRTPIPSGSNG
jgi:hypothetical protein